MALRSAIRSAELVASLAISVRPTSTEASSSKPTTPSASPTRIVSTRMSAEYWSTSMRQCAYTRRLRHASRLVCDQNNRTPHRRLGVAGQIHGPDLTGLDTGYLELTERNGARRSACISDFDSCERGAAGIRVVDCSA